MITVRLSVPNDPNGYVAEVDSLGEWTVTEGFDAEEFQGLLNLLFGPDWVPDATVIPNEGSSPDPIYIAYPEVPRADAAVEFFAPGRIIGKELPEAVPDRQY